MYKVIHFFTDLKDNSHPYNVGDTYPREGVESNRKRIEELSGKFNLQGVPLIEFVKDDDFSQYMNPPTAENEEVGESYTKTDINRMAIADLRALATRQGVENADTTSGNDLKKMLIAKLGL